MVLLMPALAAMYKQKLQSFADLRRQRFRDVCARNREQNVAIGSPRTRRLLADARTEAMLMEMVERDKPRFRDVDALISPRLESLALSSRRIPDGMCVPLMARTPPHATVAASTRAWLQCPLEPGRNRGRLHRKRDSRHRSRPHRGRPHRGRPEAAPLASRRHRCTLQAQPGTQTRLAA